MTLLEKLQAHRGGLVRLPTPLFWYGGRGWDGTPGRLCLLLDADAPTRHAADVAPITVAAVLADTTALLLIDGQPQWVRVVEKDVEFL